MPETVRLDRLPDPNALFKYANLYARRMERRGKGTKYPTVRMAAARFKCRFDEIETAIGDYTGTGYLGLAYWNVGCEVPLGDYFVEAYK